MDMMDGDDDEDGIYNQEDNAEKGALNGVYNLLLTLAHVSQMTFRQVCCSPANILSHTTCVSWHFAQGTTGPFGVVHSTLCTFLTLLPTGF